MCPAAEDGPVAASELPVPIVNYMDLTNDTCRWGGEWWLPTVACARAAAADGLAGN